MIRSQAAQPGGMYSIRDLTDNGLYCRVGAIRKLLTYREIRQPDYVADGFAVSALLAFCVVRGHRSGTALLLGFVLAGGFQYMSSRIEMPLIDWHRLAPAVAADRAQLTACFP